MKNQLKDHYKVSTEDGTETLFSTLYNESCHSNHGATKETRLHYIEGCLVPIKFLNQDKVSILEVGLGTGLGYFETCRAHWELKSTSKIFFLTLEISQELLVFCQDHAFELSDYPHFKDLKLIDDDMNLYRAEKNGHILEVLLGDARVTLPKYQQKYTNLFDCIYQDAFSPKRNPTLWTYEWFSLLKKLSSPFVALSTYSSSSSIRKAMIKAGFKITKGESFGPKRSSTRASLIGQTDPDIQAHLDHSPAIVLDDQSAENYKL